MWRTQGTETSHVPGGVERKIDSVSSGERTRNSPNRADFPHGVVGPVIVELSSKSIVERVWNGAAIEGESPVREIDLPSDRYLSRSSHVKP